MEHLIKLVYRFCPDHIAFSHSIEFFFNTGCKVIIHYRREVFHQEVVDNCTDIRRHQLIAVCPYYLFLFSIFDLSFSQCYDTICTFRTFLVTFYHIFAILDRLNSRSISRRTADTQFFQAAYKAGFRITRRTLCETFRSHDIIQCQHLVQFYRRQQTVFLILFFVVIIVVAFAIYLKETVEGDNFTHRHEFFFLIIDTNGDCCTFQFGISHLRRNCPFTDQLI